MILEYIVYIFVYLLIGLVASIIFKFCTDDDDDNAIMTGIMGVAWIIVIPIFGICAVGFGMWWISIVIGKHLQKDKYKEL